MENAVELRGLRKKLGNFELGPIDLALPQGCITGYIGENGAGKSTTIKLLLGLMRPDAGEITLLGRSMADFTPTMRKDIAYVFDDLFLPADMKLDQVQRFHQKFYGPVWQDATFKSLVARFQLPADRAIQHYSRGMKMQLGMALALSHEAKLLLLDEATSGLDPVIRDDILDLLLDYRQDESHTILVSSHILSDLEKAADMIAFIHQGQLLFMENKDDLIEKYGLIALSQDQLAAIDPCAIVGKRDHRFGTEALVLRDRVPRDWELEKPTIEDIMVYMIKGE